MNVTALGRHVIWSTLLNYAGKLLVIGTGLATTPFILDRLGPSMYGMWALVASIVAYGGLLDLGMTTAVVKYVAEYRARGKLDDLEHLLATAMWVYAGFGLAAIALGAVVAPIFPYVFQVAPEARHTASWLVFLSAAGMGVSLACSIPPAVLRGLQRFDYLNVVAVFGAVLNAGAMVLVLLLGGDVLAVGATPIVCAPVVLVVSNWLVHRAAPDLRWDWRRVKLGLLRGVVGYSAPIAVVNVSQRLQTKTDEIVIGAVMPIAMVTPFALAGRLSKAAPMLVDQFMKLLVPLASEMHAVEHPARLRSLFVTTTRLTLALYLPVGGMLVLLGGPLLSMWVGPQYAPYSYITAILIAAAMFDAASGPASSILQGMARHRLLAGTSMCTGLANLGLSLALIGPLGLAGVAIGTLIPAVIQCAVLVVPHAMRLLKVGPGEVLRQAVWPALVPALPMVAVTYALEQAIAPTSLLGVLVLGGAGALAYATTYVLMAGGRVEQQVTVVLVSSVLDKVRSEPRLAFVFRWVLR
jgi:O-antigen/teichoic acid export membrane protein